MRPNGRTDARCFRRFRVASLFADEQVPAAVVVLAVVVELQEGGSVQVLIGVRGGR